MDLLILMDAPTCGVCGKSQVGRGDRGQTKGKRQRQERNDRLIAVAVHSRRHQQVQSLDELPKELLLISYNELKGKEFNSSTETR